MAERTRHHKVPSKVKLPIQDDNGLGTHTEDILDGMEKIRAVAALVESVIVWRAQHIAWNIGLYRAEPLLYRLIFKEGSQNSSAMDLLARIYFQQGKYEKAKDLWVRASELQPGNPALRRAAFEIQKISKAPARAVLRHKIATSLRAGLLLLLFCLFGWGAVQSYRALSGTSDTIAVQNLSGRFQYAYDSITKDMVYTPAPETAAKAGDIVPSLPEAERQNMRFTRRKVVSGKDVGRIEVAVERNGSTVKASGKIPNLHVRYLVEQALMEIPGVREVDLSDLEVDRTYRVNKGDSLWIIARRVYGDGTAWTLLAKENNLKEPSKLRIGQELSLPLGDELLIPTPGN